MDHGVLLSAPRAARSMPVSPGGCGGVNAGRPSAGARHAMCAWAPLAPTEQISSSNTHTDRSWRRGSSTTAATTTTVATPTFFWGGFTG